MFPLPYFVRDRLFTILPAPRRGGPVFLRFSTRPGFPSLTAESPGSPRLHLLLAFLMNQTLFSLLLFLVFPEGVYNDGVVFLGFAHGGSV